MNTRTDKRYHFTSALHLPFSGALVIVCLLMSGLALEGNSARLIPQAQAKTTGSSALTMTPEQVESAIEEYFNACEARDVARYVSNFAPDGVLEDPVGTPPLQGQQAITAYITALFAPFSKIDFRVQEIIVRGQEAAVNWKLHLTTTAGKKITIDGMGVFKFNNAGKLVQVREFFDFEKFLADLQS